jgi:2-polyprenyl-3-methyl-5-hydroxy-6-metoxy-1,4-benzoquinol methylase
MDEQQAKYQRFSVAQTQMALASVRIKLANGTYPLEEQKCFCGVEADEELRTLDRDAIPHRIVVCKNCALVRATPRMTEAAYANFYNNEYREFTYRWLDPLPRDKGEELAGIQQREATHGQQLVQKLYNEAIDDPKVVVDFGCYQGGMLDCFKEHGAETWGIDYNAEARTICAAKGHKVVASVDELIELGVQADLIIMQDVIEHLLDFEVVYKLHRVLKPEGYLYVDTPGLFRRDPSAYWQLAHTWYFTAATLHFLMDNLGWVPTYIDEEISSFWQWRGPPQRQMVPPGEWAEYIIDEAKGAEERRLPPFRGVCKFTKRLLYDNMTANYAKGIPDIYALSNTKTGPVAIVGGGPSVDWQVHELRKLVAEGVPVIAIPRMYPWCIEHGITPTYVVSLDCSEEQEAGFAIIKPETTHLMAGLTRPALVDMIQAKGAPIYIFDARDDRRIKTLRRDAGYEVCTVINSGGTVVVTCIAAAFTMGYSDLHIFGFDCMFPNAEQTHAQGIAGKSVDQQLFLVDVNGAKILTTPSFVEFARQALDLFGVAHNEGILKSVKVYGESLITHMWDCQWHEEDGTGLEPTEGVGVADGTTAAS